MTSIIQELSNNELQNNWITSRIGEGDFRDE